MSKIINKFFAGIFLTTSVVIANAGVCYVTPGIVTCGKGPAESLLGNGLATVNGTTITGSTQVNGSLNAKNAIFNSLAINGSAKLDKCTIKDNADIKGFLSASSTTFEKSVIIYSNKIRLANSKINHDLHFRHSDSRKQTVYLDNASTIAGDVIFDDGKGEVIVSGHSKIEGKVIGGHTIIN